MNIAVQIEPVHGSPSDVDYRWDQDTDILTAKVRARAVGEGASGSVEIEGTDGSWLILDLAAGAIHGVEVAVWPEVRKKASLSPPADVLDARLRVESKNGDVASIELNTAVSADADEAERTIHFRLGAMRNTRTVRIARGILVDIDARDHIAGVWLLDVPPFPAEP